MTPLQKSIAEIEALHDAYDGMDNARTVVSHVLEILTANLEYERDVIKDAYNQGSNDMGNSEFGGRCEFLNGNDYYTKTYEHERKD